MITGAAAASASAGTSTRRQPTATPTAGDHHIPNITTLRALQKPVIAAVNGATAGAGLSLAAASDIRVRRPRPSPSPPGSTSAWCPTRGGLALRPRIIGYARALEWFATDRHMSAEEALAVGLVSELAESDALLERACELARRFTAMPPRAVGMTKRARGLAAFDAAAAASARARDASRGDPPAPQERMHAGPTEEIGSDPAYTPPGTRRPSG